MIYPLIDWQKWAQMYDLNTKTQPCLKCGKHLAKEIPFAEGNLRGLKSATHECGPSYDHKVFRSISDEDNEALKDLFSVISSAT
jgi:hypothetical protein